MFDSTYTRPFVCQKQKQTKRFFYFQISYEANNREGSYIFARHHVYG